MSVAVTLSAAAKNQGKELHGLLLSYMQLEDLHPDSLERNIDSLKQCRLQSQDAARCAVYAAAIGRLYAERMYWRSVGTDLRDSALVWYGRALAERDVLAQTKAKQWKPFVVIGKDEGYFAGDMLNVVWRSMVGSVSKSVRDTASVLPKYGEMIASYRQRGLRTGALLLAIDSLYDAGHEVTEADLLRLRDQYADLPLCAELYLRLATEGDKTPQQRREWLQQGIARYPKYKRISALKNALTRLSDPVFQWDGPTHVYPGKQYLWRFTVRNVQAVVIDGKEHAFPVHDPVETFTDSIRWMAPAVGDYTLTFVPRTSAKLAEKVRPLEQKIRVSALQALCQAMPDGRVRFLVVDAQTGRPQGGVKIEAFAPNNDTVPYFVGQTDNYGKVSVRRWVRKGSSSESAQIRFRMSRGDETHLPITSVYAHADRWQGPPSDSAETVRLYTDRNIYRPGQTVHVGGIAYNQLDWDARAISGRTYLLELLDASHKSIEQRDVTTDDMGVFSTDFTLPEDGKNGYFQLRVGNLAYAHFRVEEYKRPTFEVTLSDSLLALPTDSPQSSASSLSSSAMSCVVRGFAANYDGTPLRNARVTGSYRWQHSWFYPAKRMPFSESQPLDTLETDDEGRFQYTLSLPQGDSRMRPSLFVSVDVLSQQGESHNAQHWYWRQWPTPPPTDPAKIDSTFLVRCVADSFAIDRPGRIAVTTNLRDVCLHYMLTAAGKVWTDTMLVLSQETRFIDIPYRPEYDQSATASFCFVQDERVFTDTKTIRLARPDNQLRMRWDTFRDLLQPGQQEEWRLTLLRPDGTPADASVMVTMYDASLDYFGQHQWNFNISRGHREYAVPFRSVWNETAGISAHAWYSQKTKKERPMTFTEVDGTLFHVGAYTRGMGGVRLYKNMMVASAAPMTAMATSMDGAIMEERAEAEVALRQDDGDVDDAASEDSTGASDDTLPLVPLRENFNETAFFYPQLRTDKDGKVNITFTLPESLTRWNLLGIAHTGDLNYRNIREQVEARKDLVAQLHLPRFLRPGDEAVLTATVRNVSDVAQQGRGMMQVLDAKTEKVLKQWKADIRLEAHQDSVLHFAVSVPLTGETEGTIVRWAVEGTTCSDGEQRLLPILPATMPVTNTVAITAYDPSVQQIDLSAIFPANVAHRRLTVEYTTHPEQYALQALPVLAQAKHSDVLSLVAAYYAGVLGKALDVNMPDSTATYLERIAELQTSDGGFRWYPGMHSSPYLTREVCYLLTRLRMLTGQRVATQVNERAVHYLLTQRIDSTYLSVADLRTLYIVQYSGVILSKDEQKKVNFLLKMAKREDAEEEGYERQALLAIVLKQAGADRKARKCAELFRKYIVSNPLRGSYIEFPKGAFTSIDRKLHIHVQLMEALQRINPADTLLLGMRRYLLQQKRTQEWSTPVNSANAVFALMNGAEVQRSTSTSSRLRDLLTLTRQHTSVQNFTAQNDTLGYLRDSMEVDARTLPVRLRLQKFSKGESWGAVYADFQQNYDQVEARGEGLTVRAEYPSGMKRGNRYKVRYYISADRDYEYVTLLLPRPAATEPVNQRSGYAWSAQSGIGWGGGLGYYRQVHDATTELSFHQIPRGEYLIEEDLYVEREGTYHSGVSVIRCEYAEEFQGHSADTVLKIGQ